MSRFEPMPVWQVATAAILIGIFLFGVIESAAVRDVLIQWSTLPPLGMAMDIVGFLMLREEWKLAIVAPGQLSKEALDYNSRQLSELLRQKSQMSEEEAKKPIFHGDFWSPSVNDQIRSLQIEHDRIMTYGPDAFSIRLRKLRFEIGTGLIVFGFLLQFIGNIINNTSAQ